jgi:molybdate transport system regulatory protein
MRLMYKLWLDYRGRAFGDGPARLLDGVQQSGSLRKAAQDLGMSYNKAWRILHAAEQRLGFPLLDRSVGGSLGGGSQLTPEAQDLLKRYRALAAEVATALEAAFDRHFSDWEDPVGDMPAGAAGPEAGAAAGQGGPVAGEDPAV